MAQIQYIWIFNPITQSLQMSIDPVSIANAINTSEVPARQGNIAIFGPGNKIEDSGFYLNEAGQIVKTSGGYFA